MLDVYAKKSTFRTTLSYSHLICNNLNTFRPWLDKFPVIVASVTYTYLRILEDHHGPQFANLRQKEVNFVVGLLRERFQVGIM